MTHALTARTRVLQLTTAFAVLAAAPVVLSAQQQTTAPTHVKHHSVLKGAAVGAVGGHMTHHKHGALVGAAVGAEVQHHRNKKAAKAAAKPRS